VAPGLRELAGGSGHGNVWRNVIAQLRELEGVRLVHRGRADVWLADGHDWPPPGRPLVVQVHETSWRERELRRFLDPAFVQGIEIRTAAAFAEADQVIVPSRASLEQVVATFGLPSERVHAVAHGVEHGLFKPALDGGRELVGAPYVLFVGVLHPRKNLAALRDAIAELASNGLPHVLAIVGTPPHDTRADRFEREALAELPDHPGRVVHLQDLDQRALAALMAGADAFCLPSHFEGFGLPVLEAMACGAPVVVSDRGALPEVVGEAGIVVAPEPRAIARALGRVLSDPDRWTQMHEASLRRAAEFSWRRTAEGWLEALSAAA
jgi:glycosyltransferase involved in cell wall biosynthesis